jgi:hypothetical protein
VTVTASRIELARKCLGAFTLPQVNAPNEHSEAGTARHAKDEDAIGRGEIPQYLLDAWPGYDWRAEVAFAYDVATGEGRELGQGLKRGYGDLRPFEFAGTADVVGRNGDSVVVVDKKGFEEVTRAADNGQVRFLCLAATRAYRAKHTEGGIKDELRALDRAEFDAFELDAIHQEVRATVLEVAKVRADARNGLPVPFATGRQCRWCNAFDHCPKQRELKALVVSAQADLRVEAQIPFNDDNDAAEGYEFFRRLDILHKRLKSALYARANERPIPLGNGKLWGPRVVDGNREIDGDIAYTVIREKYGQDTADKAVERHATQKAMETALKSAVPKGAGAAAMRGVMKEIEDRGGIERSTKTVFEEFDPALPEKAVG